MGKTKTTENQWQPDVENQFTKISHQFTPVHKFVSDLCGSVVRMKPKLMNFWAGKRVSRMSNHSLLLLSLVQDPGCFGSQERFFLKTGTKSCDFGTSHSKHLRLLQAILDGLYAAEAPKRNSNLNPTNGAWETRAVFCVADCKNQQKACKSSNHWAFAADTELLSDERCGAFPTRVVGLCKVFARTAACKKPRVAKANISKLPKLNKKNLKNFQKKNQVLSTYLSKQRNYIARTSAGKLVTWTAVRIDLVAIWKICQDDFTLMPIPCNFLLDWKCIAHWIMSRPLL